MTKAIWKPQPKQFEFMRRPEYEALYGGAAGGGKSEALVIEALRQVDIPWYKGLILRKTFPQLRELIDKTLNYYPKLYPRARYNSSSHTWHFPSGAQVIFGSLQHPSDWIQYQGQAYDFLAFDELTHFTSDEYEKLKSRNRPNGPGTRVYIRSTANPGGVGHGWVKSRFIDAAPPMTRICEDVQWETPDGKKETMLLDRIFVPSTLFDNQALMQNDPKYVAHLAALPEADKQAYLYGNWDMFSGQVFTEWKNDPKHYEDRAWTHVIEPFDIPDHWSIYRGFDWGFSKPFSCGWYAVAPSGRIFRIREYYGCTGEPDRGVFMNPREVAAEIRRIEEEDPILKGKHVNGIADPAIFAESGGESVADMMQREYIYFNKGDHTRIPGKMQMHYRLAFDEKGIPQFQVFSTCKHFIRTIPALVYDERDVEDIDTHQEDHIYDECRYVLMEHPIAARKNHKPEDKLADDPLNLKEKEW